MPDIEIQGSVILLGSVNWIPTSGKLTHVGQEVLALPLNDISNAPLAPVPFPPVPPEPFGSCTAGFAAGDVKLLVNPNATGHTYNGDPILSLGSVWLQENTLPCQPMMGIGTGTAIATLPLMIVTNVSQCVGFMNGAGMQP